MGDIHITNQFGNHNKEQDVENSRPSFSLADKTGNDCNSGIGVTNFELQPDFCNGNEETIRKKQKKSKKSKKVNF